ncbi:unnamed protein product [Rotaria magnacalcarata]|uniref:Uncharacterized protein n=2 Tax=Rotaria magnacalcarata TaxID=392030 RepID=A0A816S5D2_9BILA|nr:unnamed protein product [Rotaria magnacalcarata]CAF2079715.1 unnamed protein product [Rotaria magnacalcarata]CAF4268468.1 unnamed protein product [Rotaria magnacalcarata]CAF4329715.1 unnamed protein product [Rotaria magnacalcarata]
MLYREEDIFRLDQHCSTIRNAVLYTIQEHKIKTADIGSTSTTTQFIDCALNGIVKMTSKIVFNASRQKINENDLKELLKNSGSIFSNRQLDRLFSKRDSYKRVDRLINCFPQKKTLIKRNRLQQNDLEDKASSSLKEEQQLKEKLYLFISYIKQLKEQVAK